MAEEREQQIRERVEGAKRHWQSRGFGLSKEEYAQWIKDGAAAYRLHNDAADDLAYLLDALAAAREENKALRDALETVETAWAYSWDCSRDPGHPLMKQAMEVAEAALAREATDAE